MKKSYLKTFELWDYANNELCMLYENTNFWKARLFFGQFFNGRYKVVWQDGFYIKSRFINL